MGLSKEADMQLAATIIILATCIALAGGVVGWAIRDHKAQRQAAVFERLDPYGHHQVIDLRDRVRDPEPVAR